MDQQQSQPSRQGNPRRRRRTKAQIIKEAYLPVIIAGVALVLMIIFIVGSITRGVQKAQLKKEASIAASAAQQAEERRLAEESAQLLTQAQQLVTGYDYDGAIELLNSFSGNPNNFPELTAKKAEYMEAKNHLVPWEDPTQVVNLSFQVLIADPARAFADSTYGTSYNRNFVTVDEFSSILMQLYDNDYVLVDLEDFVTLQMNDDGTTSYAAKPLYLPEGKKPLVLTQTQVNYYTYMVDSDGDRLPDGKAAGFANRLVLDANGKLTCQMVNAEGVTVLGDYDLVPILNRFLETHPDFSYQGAKAILAVTGYDGLFGYRTNPGALDTFGEDQYNQDVNDAIAIIKALRADGYRLACYTYDNIAYGSSGVSEIQADISNWSKEVTPLLGGTDILVFARESDIAGSQELYAGEKYNILANAGFRYYLGFRTDGTPWSMLTNDYMRQGRLMVSGSTMAHHADWFQGIFDADTVLDSARGSVPN